MSFAKQFVSEEILEHFKVKNLTETHCIIFIELLENGDIEHIPEEILRKGKVMKDGYMKSVDLQSFSAQGKEVYIRLKRRR